MPKNHHCTCGRSHLLTPVPSDKIVIDALTLKKLALLIGQSFYDVQISRTSDILLTSLSHYLIESSTADEVEIEKASLLLTGYLDVVPDLLKGAEEFLHEVGEQLAFILAASGHGVASGKRDDE